jgi:hypothetical protein
MSDECCYLWTEARDGDHDENGIITMMLMTQVHERGHEKVPVIKISSRIKKKKKRRDKN